MTVGGKCKKGGTFQNQVVTLTGFFFFLLFQREWRAMVCVCVMADRA
jgi:hypothetical protein